MTQPNRIADVKPLTLEDVKMLAGAPGPCLTMLIPLAAAPSVAGKNSLRIKNAIESARSKLADQGIVQEECDQMLAPLAELINDYEWGTDAAALAVFRSPDVLRLYRSQSPLPAMTVVGPRFHVTRFLPVLNAERPFYVLALSQKHIHLLRCTTTTCQEVALPEGTPTKVSDETLPTQRPGDYENRFSGGPSTGSMSGVRFTTNTERETKSEHLAHLYRRVSQSLEDMLRDSGAPLVLAGVSYEISLFRRSSEYPHIAEDAVQGSPDGMRREDVHRRAIEAVGPSFESRLNRALARFEEEGSGRTSTRIQEIVAAAWDGRILDLILAQDAEYPGSYDPATHRIRKDPLLGEEDLLNAAALETLLHAGEVFVVPASKVPHGAPAAAVYRY